MLLRRLPWMAFSTAAPLPLYSFSSSIPKQLTFSPLSFCSTSELHLTQHPNNNNKPVISFSFHFLGFTFPSTFTHFFYSSLPFTCRNTKLIIVARSFSNPVFISLEHPLEILKTSPSGIWYIFHYAFFFFLYIYLAKQLN